MSPAQALHREIEREVEEFFESPPIDEWHEATRHSRSRRPCTECGATIQRGEAYRRISAFTDHRWVTISRCRACEDLAFWLADLGIDPEQLDLALAVDRARQAGYDLPKPKEYRRQWEASASQTVQEGLS